MAYLSYRYPLLIVFVRVLTSITNAISVVVTLLHAWLTLVIILLHIIMPGPRLCHETNLDVANYRPLNDGIQVDEPRTDSARTMAEALLSYVMSRLPKLADDVSQMR